MDKKNNTNKKKILNYIKEDENSQVSDSQVNENSQIKDISSMINNTPLGELKKNFSHGSWDSDSTKLISNDGNFQRVMKIFNHPDNALSEIHLTEYDLNSSENTELKTIESLVKSGKKQKDIGDIIDKNQSTVSRKKNKKK